jgi:hypothetical protein
MGLEKIFSRSTDSRQTKDCVCHKTEEVAAKAATLKLGDFVELSGI